IQEPGLPIVVNGQEEWDVDEILASRGYYGKLQYRVKWANSNPDPAWYYASDLGNCSTGLNGQIATQTQLGITL
ncbi:hypothetical protein V501_00153, partial [Pseudogymnoascus sp. VKM F-4519 (FW-2642)]